MPFKTGKLDSKTLRKKRNKATIKGINKKLTLGQKYKPFKTAKLNSKGNIPHWEKNSIHNNAFSNYRIIWNNMAEVRPKRSAAY